MPIIWKDSMLKHHVNTSTKLQMILVISPAHLKIVSPVSASQSFKYAVASYTLFPDVRWERTRWTNTTKIKYKDDFVSTNIDLSTYYNPTILFLVVVCNVFFSENICVFFSTRSLDVGGHSLSLCFFQRTCVGKLGFFLTEPLYIKS